METPGAEEPTPATSATEALRSLIPQSEVNKLVGKRNDTHGIIQFAFHVTCGVVTATGIYYASCMIFHLTPTHEHH
jgi:hypothetical protein